MRPLAWLVLALLPWPLVACGTGPDPEAATPPVTASAAAVRRMLVPEVVALPAPAARAALARAGLRMRHVQMTGSACLPRGEVVGQDPAAGARVPIGSRVVVEVSVGAMGECGLDLPPAPAQLDRVARLFIRFARGHGTPPVDTPVRLHLGGRHVRTLATEVAEDRSAWRTCPSQGSYAGHSCPFSAVDVLADHPGPLAVTSRPPEHPCAHPAPLPGAASGRAVTIQADQQMTCVDYFAVQLLVNDVGQVTAVDLVLAEP